MHALFQGSVIKTAISLSNTTQGFSPKKKKIVSFLILFPRATVSFLKYHNGSQRIWKSHHGVDKDLQSVAGANFAHTDETAAEVQALNWFDDILQRDYSEIENATTTQSSIIEREEAGENSAWLDNLVNEAANVSAQSDCGSCKTIDIIVQEKTDDEFMNVQPTIGIVNEVASVSIQSDCGILKKSEINVTAQKKTDECKILEHRKRSYNPFSAANAELTMPYIKIYKAYEVT